MTLYVVHQMGIFYFFEKEIYITLVVVKLNGSLFPQKLETQLVLWEERSKKLKLSGKLHMEETEMFSILQNLRECIK